MPGNTSLQLEGQKLKAAARRPQVLTYRMAGASTRVIAERLGVSHTTIVNDLHAAYTEFAEKEAAATAEHRALEGERLDKLQAAIWVQALSGDLQAVMACVAIMDRRARLFALDKPVQLRMLVEDGTQKQVEAIYARLATRLDEATFKRVLEALA